MASLTSQVPGPQPSLGATPEPAGPVWRADEGDADLGNVRGAVGTQSDHAGVMVLIEELLLDLIEEERHGLILHRVEAAAVSSAIAASVEDPLARRSAGASMS